MSVSELTESDIEWDEWFQDIVRPDGSIMAKDALFIRGRYNTEWGTLEYYTPIWPEALKDNEEGTRQMARESVVMCIQRHIRGLKGFYEHLSN